MDRQTTNSSREPSEFVRQFAQVYNEKNGFGRIIEGLYVAIDVSRGDPHPFLGKADSATGLSMNDKFRAIHDLFGHAAEGYGFGPRGEENAWIKHCQMFGTDAQKAMTTEFRGQNAWINFGAHNYDQKGNHNNRPFAERPYAVQKVALLPTEFLDFRLALEAARISPRTGTRNLVESPIEREVGEWGS